MNKLKADKKRTFPVWLLILFLPVLLLLPGCISLSTRAVPGETPLPWETGSGDWEYAGTVTVQNRSWNWLFRSPPESRLGLMEEAAAGKARELYGPGAIALTRTVGSRWHPLSLLMLLDLLGFVEDSALTARVWIPVAAPPPPSAPIPEEKKLRQIITYRVESRENYTAAGQFTLVEYQSAGDLLAQLDDERDRGELSPGKYQEKRGEIPAGGLLIVSLGRKVLENAISRWFQFTLTEGSMRLFQKNGVEDIPFVPGKDQLWWNVLKLEIREEWTSPLDFTIQDTYLNQLYHFRIIKDTREVSDDL